LENLGFATEGDGWKVTEAGETALGGRLPVNPSGGVLSSNPIGASGMLRFSEAAKQVMGHAPATTRSTARASHSATPTAAVPSTSRCGSSAPPSRDSTRGFARCRHVASSSQRDELGPVIFRQLGLDGGEDSAAEEFELAA
jgi:hypothetical protein